MRSRLIIVSFSAAMVLIGSSLRAADQIVEDSPNGEGCGSMTDYSASASGGGVQWGHGASPTGGGWTAYATYYNRANAHGGFYAARTEALPWHTFCF